MKINTTSLFYREVYVYDISSCHYQILINFGYDLSDIKKDDKLKRNIKIGLMMKDNPKLIDLLRGTTERTISEIILSNELKEDEILLRQYDGIIITRMISNLNVGLDIGLRHVFSPMIISIDKNSYISFDGCTTTAKGISNMYAGIYKYYNRLLLINFLSKTSIFKELGKIKEEFIKSRDINDFIIRDRESNNIFLKEFGKLSISENSLSIIDIDDIDRTIYWNNYIVPFTKSIVNTFA